MEEKRINEISQEKQDKNISLADYSVRQLLLNRQEDLFLSIYKSEQLTKKIIYCMVYAFIFAGIYGVILGSYWGMQEGFVMALKVPLVLFGTLLISLPLLFTYNIFLGTSLSLMQVAVIILLATYLISVALISLASIVLLFVIYAEGAGFLNLLNIIFFVIAGSVGISFLWKTMDYFLHKSESDTTTWAIKIWSVIYVFVGLQIAWILKVFGDLSELPVFKQLGIEGNFYMAIFELLKSLIADD